MLILAYQGASTPQQELHQHGQVQLGLAGCHARIDLILLSFLTA